MNKQETNERIDRITHRDLPRAFYSVIDELLDRGYEWSDIQKYLQSRYSEALTYLHNESQGVEGSRQHYLRHGKELITEKDYAKKNAPVAWAVMFKGIVMASDFVSKQDAEHFRDNAYFGYYNHCEVKCIKIHK